MKLRTIHVKGFKSINAQDGQNIPFGDITVLLGANGSGKSNIVSLFEMLNFMTTGALQQYVGKHGASRLLFYGTKETKSVSLTFNFESDLAHSKYEVSLSHGLPDRLFVSGEKITYHRINPPSSRPQEYYLDAGGSESQLGNDSNKTSKTIYKLLSGIRTYQFHDTSDTAKIKDRGYVDDARYLRHNAGNLAAFLKMLKDNTNYKKYYDRIVRHIRRVMPQFHDFELTPITGNKDYVRLNWIDSLNSDYLFDPNQISDGSLRFMALATLLLQPPALLPQFIVLDEPELGLHPAAIAELASIVRSASKKTQILMATQSTRLVDEFSLDNLVVVERDDEQQCSTFQKFDSERLNEWLDRYSLSELWEKNVLGGQP
ncbi:AAA family ATPase [Pseudodesulfovibrio sp. F-1]|uniref:AAA family ATPase n=1 Tax=Pseudodesulfovibrio alkaliphilus TaxID=2661613 RepID=A0A7K1KPA7_9BACT|nr:AAA family ATPase [Pseudodesulfovibrio alkaliphilus]MUM77923.1 AAA family ATPase [Pseudodesulfovibrio alkaliphilus]